VSGFVDVHAHFVYGVDDGAHSREEMFAMLDSAYEQGVGTLFATSHATPGVRLFPREMYDNHFAEAEQYCAQRGYNMKLCRGAEILYTPMLDGAAMEHVLPTLAGTDWVLVEFMPTVSLKELITAFDLLTRRGYMVLVAHIERYKCLANGTILNRLKSEYPIRCQLNCSTVIKAGGFFCRRRVDNWLKAGIVDVIASDMHNISTRPECMRDAYECVVRLCGKSVADNITGRDGELFDGKEFHF